MIQFRAKSIETREWVYGDYFKKWIQTRSDNGRLEHYIGNQYKDSDDMMWNETTTIDETTLELVKDIGLTLDIRGSYQMDLDRANYKLASYLLDKCSGVLSNGEWSYVTKLSNDIQSIKAQLKELE